MKKLRLTAVVWLLGFAAEAALLLFLTPVYTAVTWITLGFTAAAWLSQAALWRGGGEEDRFLLYPGMTVSAGYLLAQLVLCCVFARVAVTVKTAVFVNLLVALIAWILLISTVLARGHIKKVDQGQKDHHVRL